MRGRSGSLVLAWVWATALGTGACGGGVATCESACDRIFACGFQDPNHTEEVCEDNCLARGFSRERRECLTHMPCDPDAYDHCILPGVFPPER